MLRRFNAAGNRPDFTTRYPLETVDQKTHETVTTILGDVRESGWEKVREYSRKYDDVAPDGAALEPDRLEEAWSRLTEDQKAAFDRAHDRITRYQRAIKPSSSLITDGSSGKLGEVIRPLETAGCYIPGGRFPLPSTVLMTALVAEVAGVENLVVCTPPASDGGPHEAILAACSMLESVDVFPVGGVQAVAAMAYGAGPVPAVDLIAGPGNLYVTLAKKQVFGRVNIDLLAGPSEICVIADSETGNPRWIAADLLSQAEHDPNSRVFALSPDETLLDDVEEEIGDLLADHPNPDPIREALQQSALIATKDLPEAIRLSNELAPEHLELHLADSETVARECVNAGAVFCGPYAPEPLGDYTAGPSHTLPTGGTARFFSPLSVRTFMKSQSLIGADATGFDGLAGPTECLADLESLHFHHESISVRRDGDSQS